MNNAQSIKPKVLKDEAYVCALDIGTTKICCMVAQRNEFGKIEIVAIGKADSLGVIRGEVQNINLTADAIEKAVREAEAQCGLPIKDVWVGIAGSHIRSFQHRGQLLKENADEISTEDVRNLIQSMYRLRIEPGDRIIHVLPQDYIVDNEHDIHHPVGVMGTRLEANFHIITGKIHAANCIERAVKKAGLNVVDIILEPIASSASVLGEDEKEAGVALVDIGGGTSDVAVFKDGIIQHTFVIGMGGNTITEDIRNGLMITKEHAEKLKVKHGQALPNHVPDTEFVIIEGIRGRDAKEISRQNLARIIEARLDEIFEHVDNELKRNELDKRLVAGLVVTGGGAALRHLKQLVEYRMGMDVRIGAPTEHLTSSTIGAVNHPMFATAVGLIIKGFEDLDARNLKVEAEVTETPVIEKQTDVKTDEKLQNHQKQDQKGNVKTRFWNKFSQWWNDQEQEDFEN